MQFPIPEDIRIWPDDDFSPEDQSEHLVDASSEAGSWDEGTKGY